MQGGTHESHPDNHCDCLVWLSSPIGIPREEIKESDIGTMSDELCETCHKVTQRVEGWDYCTCPPPPKSAEWHLNRAQEVASILQARGIFCEVDDQPYEPPFAKLRIPRPGGQYEVFVLVGESEDHVGTAEKLIKREVFLIKNWLQEELEDRISAAIRRPITKGTPL